MSEKNSGGGRGQRATLIVNVRFARNDTWQGDVTWAEQKKTVAFRSALELIKLMDSAVSAGPDAGATELGIE